jgi:light-regulated signal transduction histidine kinase (bacteriophytochrome)
MVAIQPCAVLLAVGPDWQVETISANAAMLGDHRPVDLIGQPLADLIGSKAIHNLRNRLSWLSRDESEVQDFGVQWGDVTLDVCATRSDDHYLIEAELAVEPRLPDGIGMVRSMSDRLTGKDIPGLAKQAMLQLGAVTGFEHLQLCDRKGATIAANRSAASAFDLGCVEFARIVADRDAEPVPLVGADEGSLIGRAAYLALDEAESGRLRTMGIAARLSLPLRIDGELVATLHALHGSPRRCGAERRSVAHLFAERLVARMARMGWEDYPLAP